MATSVKLTYSFFPLTYGGRVELIVSVDSKGRVVIPAEVRRKLGIERTVKMIVKEGRIIIEPIRNPIEYLRSIVELKIVASQEPEKISRIAEKQLRKMY
ncbi:MAG: AbrB family transcriptional regulator [Thermoprotei archaeon]|nr:MAG: AbrB family transcriptional regulator [Thermoprotei archaeon]